MRTPSRYRLRVRVTGSLAVLGVAGLAVAHGSGVVGLDQAVRIAVAIVGALALILAVGIVRDQAEPPLQVPAAVITARPPGRVERLAGWTVDRASWRRRAIEGRRHRTDLSGEWAGVEQIVRFSETSAMDFHVRLRPRISAVVTRRLEIAGVDPADSARVAELLGPIGPLVADRRPRPPEDRQAPGVPAPAVRDLLRRVEELS